MKLTHPLRTLAVAATVGATGLGFGACGSGSDELTMCGLPYTLVFSHHQYSAGSCAGVIDPYGKSILIKRGTHFSIEIIHSGSGVLDYPLPLSTNVPIQLTGLSNGTATYLAAHVGHAQLVSYHALECGKKSGFPYRGYHNCTPYSIDVTP